MGYFEEFKVLLKNKSGKKLAAVSVIVFLLVTAITFFTLFRYFEKNQIKQMEEYLGEIPNISETRVNDLMTQRNLSEEDAASRAELGSLFYADLDEKSEEERLAQVRDAAGADSVSLLNEKRETVVSTGPVSPKETFLSCIETLKQGEPCLELYPVISDTSEKTQVNGGKIFVLFPAGKDTADSLVFEFSCDDLLEQINDVDNWSGLFEQMLAGADYVTAARKENRFEVYPADSLTSQDCSQLNEELNEKLKNPGRLSGSVNGIPVRFVTLLNQRYFAAHAKYEQDDTDVLLMVPMKKAAGNGLFIAVSLSLVMGLGILMLQYYIFRQLLDHRIILENESTDYKKLFQLTMPGIVVVMLVISVFSSMLLMLEIRTDAAITALRKRQNLESQISQRKEKEDSIRSTFEDHYRSRTRCLADLLTAHPEYENSASFAAFSPIMKSEYLMRFDKSGQELFSSNIYTGFAVGKNLSDEYQAVLLGYPDAVVGPQEDPYTKEMQLGTAIMMLDSDGKPDGFLLAVYDAGDLSEGLKRLNYENTVSNFAVQEGNIAAAISDENGVYIAHTDHDMIGQKAVTSLKEYSPGISYEGFTDYNNRTVGISASGQDGKTLLYIVPLRREAYLQASFSLSDFVILILLAALYYPGAVMLIAQAIREADGDLQLRNRKKNPIAIFIEGYSVFLALFALFVLIASEYGWWTSFDYVFSGLWSYGVHLYSFWAVLFMIAVTFSFLILLRKGTRRMERKLAYQGQTVLKLISSFITYAVFLFLFFGTLTLFGVNTATMLASAGIISIAVGMGAQNLAADLLAGFLLILEGSIRVGDHVQILGTEGYVTDIGIRTTEITDAEGNAMIVNNSMVSPVFNMTRKRKDQSTQDKDTENKDS